MDKKETRLESLSDDVWELLFQFLDLSHIWALLSTGSRILGIKLTRRMILPHVNIRRTNFELLKAFERRTGWSHLLSLQANISSPDIGQILDHYPALRARLPLLTSLKVTAPYSGQWAAQNVINSSQNFVDTFPSLKRLQIHLTGDDSFSSRLLFPNTLTSIEMKGVVAYRSSLEREPIQLPPLLTRYHWISGPHLDEIATLTLPNTLTSLEARFEFPIQDCLVSSEEVLDPLFTLGFTPRELRELLDDDHPNWSNMRIPIRKTPLSDPDDTFGDSEGNVSEEGFFGPNDGHFPLVDIHRVRNERFGRLRRLKKLVHLSARIDEVYVAPWDLLNMPSSLTSLSVPLPRFVEPDAIINALNHTLEEPERSTVVSERIEFISTFVRECLPPKLIHYDMPILTDWAYVYRRSKPSLMLLRAQLPRNLISFSNELFSCTAESPKAINDIIQYSDMLSIDRSRVALPSSWTNFAGLQTLDLGRGLEFAFEKIALLPPTITKFSASTRDISELPALIHRYSDLATQRRNLLRLESEYKIEPSENVRFWPPLLTDLRLGGASILLLDVLPKSLTSYLFNELTVGSEAIAEISRFSPHLLRCVNEESLERATRILFNLFEGRDVAKVSFSLDSYDTFPHLWKTTEEISLAPFRYVRASDFANFERLKTIIDHRGAVDHEIAAWIPSSVDTVDFSRNSTSKQVFQDCFLVRMPNTVKSVKLPLLRRTLATVHHTFPTGAYGTELNDETLIQSSNDLLASEKGSGRIVSGEYSSLEGFSVSCSNGERLPEIITSIDISADFDVMFYSILPISLTRLKISNAFCITEECFALLPQTLLELELMAQISNAPISDKAIALAPKSLTSLKLPMSTMFTSNCLAGLSSMSNLKVVSVRTESITDSSLPDIPPSVTHLEIPWSRITEKGIALLPPQLTYLDLTGCEFLRNADPSLLPPSLTKLFASEEFSSKISPELFPGLSNTTSNAPEMSGLFDF